MMMKAFMTRFLRAPALSTVPVPSPEPGELQIKVAYVSLNPTDYKHASMALPPSKIIGCEFSGTVTSLGHDVDPSSFSKGDRVAGVVHGCKNSHAGAFADTVVADANMCWKVPSNITMEAASTLSVGWVSAAQTLAQRLYHGGEDSEGTPDTLLVYSAATNTGMHAIQQARLEHPNTFIIAIASSQHHARLRELGANATFDYKSPSLVSDVQGLGRDIRKAVDCHSEGASTVLTAKCMMPKEQASANGQHKGHSPRRIIRTLPPAMMSGTVPTGVKADEWILAYTALGKPFWFLFKYYAAVPQDYQTASRYLKELTPVLESGKIQPVKHRLMPGGLADIGSGFEEMRSGRVRGEKLVYQVSAEEGTAPSFRPLVSAPNTALP